MKNSMIGFFAFALVANTQTHSAEIFVQKDARDGVSLVGIQGVIEADDDRKFSEIVFGLSVCPMSS